MHKYTEITIATEKKKATAFYCSSLFNILSAGSLSLGLYDNIGETVPIRALRWYRFKRYDGTVSPILSPIHV